MRDKPRFGHVTVLRVNGLSWCLLHVTGIRGSPSLGAYARIPRGLPTRALIQATRGVFLVVTRNKWTSSVPCLPC